MKSFPTTFRTLLLSCVLIVSAAAQEATLRDAANEPAAGSAQAVTDSSQPQGQRTQVAPGEELGDNLLTLEKTAAASPSQTTHVPVAEAKKHYKAAQERLQNLLQGRSLRSPERILIDRDGELEVTIHDPRDRLRAAVAEDFDARRKLQQAELAELERRVARIKRAMDIRDAMRDTIIDQRTDELLEQMQDGGKDDNRGTPFKSDEGHSRDPDATNSTASGRVWDTDLRRQARRLRDEVIKAKTVFESTKRAHERALRLYKSGTLSKDAFDQFLGELARNKDWVDRSTLSWDVFRKAYPNLPETKEPAADGAAPGGRGAATPGAKDGAANPSAGIDADAIGHDARPLELDAYDAIANFESAERAYRRLEKLRASGAIEQAVLDEQVDKLSAARVQLERAAVKAALDVEEAEANLESAGRAFTRAEKLHATGAIEQAVLDQQADQCNRAQIQLDRAESKVNAFNRVDKKLKALDESPPGDGAIIAPTRSNSFLSAFDKSLIDWDQIAWGPKDSDQCQCFVRQSSIE